MRRQMERFKQQLSDQGKLQGRESVLIAFDHLLDLLDEHEEKHRLEIGARSTNGEKSNGEVEAAIRAETEFFRDAVRTVIERTIADLVHRGDKEWKKFYDRID
ncbi:hypothetical protein HGI30_11455 [Paenibacillus albicereus]|uniref:Uncharacterized protein n=1 Tax=Paenibacillus albicereus TaxID=2726185 RepID=A0A6H2GXH0_9BACL|nr:hypothetical protein [Paenibacillus albicereus]QJC52110.1 hypothetical protein HGI30_11455 [Paenibacillus albicereus]